MSSIKVTGIQEALSRIDDARKINRVMNSATKRTERAAKTVVSRSIRDELALPKKYVDERFKAYGIYRPDHYSIVISAQQRGILFRNFRHFVSKKGQMRLTIKPGQTQTIKRTWNLKLRQGGTTPVYWREKPQVRRGRVGYWNNLAMHAPSPSQVFKTKKEEIGGLIKERYKREIATAINYYMRVK